MAICATCGNRLEGKDKYCPACGTEVGVRPSTEYRIVTVFFSDVEQSTDLERRLGPLPTQWVKQRYGEAVRGIAGARGASVGKRHGDGFMAAFGVPELHEDDALRAVKAAVELRKALDELAEEVRTRWGEEFHVRLGMNTGKVLVGDAGSLEEELTGTSVNLAKRFEEAAGPDEILIGEETYRLVDYAVETGEAMALTVDGFPEPQKVWRLREVRPDRPGRPRRRDAPMVGRALEQALLLQLFERVEAERSCHLVTVLGSAGVGKSRLVDEFVTRLEGQARVLRAHCPALGDSVTMWPMVEIVRQAAGIDPADPPELASDRLAEVLGGEDTSKLVERIAQLLGFRQEAGQDADTSWALQRLLETLARRQPLVLVIDDLQFADPILLGVVEHIAEYTVDAPLMLLCMARTDELLLRRRHWPGGNINVLSLQLSPLPDREGQQLVEHLLGGKVDAKVQWHVTDSAQGYPLLVEEVVDKLRADGWLESRDGRWQLQDSEESVDQASLPIPTSIDALLLARLERLSDRGRRVIEPAAVVGQQFHRGDIEALAPGGSLADLEVGLQELVRLDLIRPDHGRASVPLPPDSGPGYGFRHATVKQVAYERLPDDQRAELHERYADWLERQTADRRSQFDEMVGLHFYEAYRLASKLDPGGAHTAELARRAGERYAAAGHRAAVRGDKRLVQAWLGRATKLLPADHPTRLRALSPLAEALQAIGRLTEAERAYEDLARSAKKAGDEGLAAHASIGGLHVTAQHDPQEFLLKGRDQIELEIPVFQRLQDNLGLAKAWHLLAYFDWMRGRLGMAEVSADRAKGFARKAGDASWEATVLSLYCLILYWGPTPLEQVSRQVQKALDEKEHQEMRTLQATGLTVLARVAALQGDLDRARELIGSAGQITDDPGLGGLLTQAAQCISLALVDLLDRDPAAAEVTLRDGLRRLESMGGNGPRANVASLLARVRLVQGDNEEAEELTRICERIAGADQLDVQIRWRSIRAIVLAGRGELEAAERLARRAVYLADQTDQPASRAEAHLDLAQVLRFGGHYGEERRELKLGAQLYKEKGSHVAEREANKRLEHSLS
jgi:class 3 adenylate cyclase/tetratricopeptide (TPR) repeat protein